MKKDPPHGSATRHTPLSCCSSNCVSRATRAAPSDGSAKASSNAFVCRDCAPPWTAASASRAVLATLLSGSWAVKEYPDVWTCVRNTKAFSFVKTSPCLCFKFLGPELARRAELRDLDVVVHAHGEEEG